MWQNWKIKLECFAVVEGSTKGNAHNQISNASQINAEIKQMPTKN